MKNITHNSSSFLSSTIRIAVVAVALGIASMAQAAPFPADDSKLAPFDRPAHHAIQSPRQSQMKKSGITSQRSKTNMGNRHSFLTPGGTSVEWTD